MSRSSWREAISTYATAVTLALFLLGFAAGLPYILVASTLSVWLREAGVSLETIGFASLISLVYSFKWVWSPMLDQWRLPLLGRLGRRRSWLILSQLLIAIGLIGMALCDPKDYLAWMIALSLLVAFASATQDIAIDAYRLEIADQSRQAVLASAYQAGYRIAVLLATAGALYLAAGLGSTKEDYNFSAWSWTYLIFALTMIPALLTSIWVKEPNVPASIVENRYGFMRQLFSVLVLIVLLVSVPALITQLFDTDFGLVVRGETTITGLFQEDRALMRATLYAILVTLCLSPFGRRGLAPVLTPVSDFVLRYRWQALLLLGLIATYRMSDTVMGTIANVFYLDIGFKKEEIASISKIFGVFMTLLGAAAGGVLIIRFSIMPILFIGALASAATNLMFAMLANMGPNLSMLVVTISCDNFSAGMATSAFVAYLSALTNLKFSATQYALLSSIMLLLPRLIGGYSGAMAEKLGYPNFFVITAIMGIPTLILILVQWSRDRRIQP